MELEPGADQAPAVVDDIGCSNWTVVARAIAFSVSPVASETRCRLIRLLGMD